MGKPDIIYECHEGDTAYRIQPNPDAQPGVGFRNGAVLTWSDNGREWDGHFFIAPEALEAVGIALTEAAKDAPKEGYGG